MKSTGQLRPNAPAADGTAPPPAHHHSGGHELRRVAALNCRGPNARARLLELRGQVRAQSNKREERRAERWAKHVELTEKVYAQAHPPAGGIILAGCVSR